MGQKLSDSKKKQKENKLNGVKERIAKLMEFHGIEENLKGAIVTIKNISKFEKVITDKKQIPSKYYDKMFSIPTEQFKMLPETMKAFLQRFMDADKLNEERITEADETIPGVERKYKYNSSFLGLAKIEKKVS